MARPAEQHSNSAAHAEVGFWAGEDVHNPKHEPLDRTYWNGADATAMTAQVWNVLATNHVPLYFHLRYERDFGPVPRGHTRHLAALHLVQHANRLHVPVIAWLVVPFTNGYWAYEGNAAIQQRALEAWQQWTQQHHLHFREVVLDLEFSYQGLQKFLGGLAGRPDQLAAFMQHNIDPAGQCTAMRDYRNIIDWAHARGVRITGTPVPFALDDLDDNHVAMQDALDIAAFPPLGYDQLYLQAYRGSVAQAIGVDPGSAWVASYAESMRNDFGSHGQVSLGIGGQLPYDKIGTLTTDIRMLAALGVTGIPIYSLETTVKTFGAAGLRTIVHAGSQPLTGTALAVATAPTPQSIGTRRFFDSIDALATSLTLEKTTAAGQPRGPNAYPGGCGDLRARPLEPSGPAG
jgi:hypothetical protein